MMLLMERWKPLLMERSLNTLHFNKRIKTSFIKGSRMLKKIVQIVFCYFIVGNQLMLAMSCNQKDYVVVPREEPRLYTINKPRNFNKFLESQKITFDELKNDEQKALNVICAAAQESRFEIVLYLFKNNKIQQCLYNQLNAIYDKIDEIYCKNCINFDVKFYNLLVITLICKLGLKFTSLIKPLKEEAVDANGFLMPFYDPFHFERVYAGRLLHVIIADDYSFEFFLNTTSPLMHQFLLINVSEDDYLEAIKFTIYHENKEKFDFLLHKFYWISKCRVLDDNLIQSMPLEWRQDALAKKRNEFFCGCEIL